MAFDFLGTFTQKMWTSFEKFTTNVVYGSLFSLASTSLSYDTKKHQFSQRHLPRVRDHQLAENQRLEIYQERLTASLRKKFSVGYTSRDSLVIYNPLPGPAYPRTNAKEQSTWILQDYYPVNTNDDYEPADILLYIKSKIARFIKSRFERDEYRVKKCIDLLDTTFSEHTELDIFMQGSSSFLSYQSLKQQITEGFTNETMPSLLKSQFSVDPDNLDGESTSSTDQALVKSLESNTKSTIIAGDPQKLIYRGLLHHKKEVSASKESTDMFENLRRLQNPYSPD